MEADKIALQGVGGGGTRPRSPQDFYPTPADVTTALMDFLNLDGESRIWEPACGEMDMVRTMERLGYKVTATDIKSGVDFLTSNPIECDWIITNPPFTIADEFIKRCRELNKPFALLLKSQYWHAAKRLRLFSEITPSYILPLTWRPDFLFKQQRKGSPLMDVMWCVWEPPYNGECGYYPLKRNKCELSNIHIAD